MAPDGQRIPLSQLIGALSYALDLTEGEPAGHAVRSCKIGMRLAQELGSTPRRASQLFYALLLKDAGCSANSAKMAALFDADDHVAKRDVEADRLVRAGCPRSSGRCARSRPSGGSAARGSSACARSSPRARSRAR